MELGFRERCGIAVVVILTGVGTSCCADADFANPPNPIEQSRDLFNCLARNPVHQMSHLTVSLIGALHGHVITGGFETALVWHSGWRSHRPISRCARQV